jgi:hypothetical protein
MGLIIKAVLAFCIGGAAMYGLQRVWLSNIKQQLATQRVMIPQAQMKPIPAVDPTKMRAALYPKIDPKIGQDAWRGTLNRQINQSINAGRMVPPAATALRLPR